MSDFAYQSFQIGNTPKKLIVFLHGYNSCIDDLLPSIKVLENNLSDTIIVAPSSELTCERNPLKKQWILNFSSFFHNIHKFFFILLFFYDILFLISIRRKFIQ